MPRQKILAWYFWHARKFWRANVARQKILLCQRGTPEFFGVLAWHARNFWRASLARQKFLACQLGTPEIFWRAEI